MSQYGKWTEIILPAILVLGLATRGWAQTGPLAHADQASQPAPALVDEVAADSLLRAAERLYATPAEAAQAARLQLESATLRPYGSAHRLESLRMAARLFGYAGDWHHARATMAAVADEILAFGDVAAAANTYVDAAFMAVHEARPNELLRLTERARWLASLPMVRPEQRADILRRIQ